MDNNFVVLMRSNDLNLARLGLAISKKRLKAANARNRAKRIVRESFRHHQEQLSGYDVVVINRDGVKESNNQELLLSLEHHWNNLVK